jgi:hypothetical protein
MPTPLHPMYEGTNHADDEHDDRWCGECEVAWDATHWVEAEGTRRRSMPTPEPFPAVDVTDKDWLEKLLGIGK